MKKNRTTTWMLKAVTALSMVLLVGSYGLATPTINSISPTTAEFENPGFTLSVFGENFQEGVVIRFGSDILQTTFVSASELEAFVPEKYFIAAGSFGITVVNPVPDNAPSNIVYFKVNQNENATYGISPQSAPMGNEGILLKITGKDFMRSTSVTMNGYARNVLYMNSNEIYARLVAEDVRYPGKNIITVVTPSVDGEEQFTAVFTVYSPKTGGGSVYTGDENARVLTGSTPTEFAVAQNYPNPFNPSTTIGFSLPASGAVNIQVFNSIGQVIATLADGTTFSAGEHSVQFNASDIASGEYFYRVSVNDEIGNSYTSLNKMLFVK